MLRLHCKNQGCLAAILVLSLRVEIIVVGNLLDERCFPLPELAIVLGERIPRLELSDQQWVVIFIFDETRGVALHPSIGCRYGGSR